MTIKNLTGWQLILGPLGIFLTWMLVAPLLGVDGEGAEGLQQAIDNPLAFNLVGMLSALSMTAMLIGSAMLARSIYADGGAGGPYAAIALFLYPAILAVQMSSMGLTVGAVAVASAESATLQLVSDQITAAMPMFWGLAFITLGAGLALEKKLLDGRAGWIVVLLGLAMVSGMFWDNDTAGNVMWLVFTLVQVGLGVLVLRSDD